MKKRMISMLLLLAMLLSIVPAASAAEAASGTCEENLTWTLDDSGTLTISGTGEMTDFNYDYSPWYGQCENILAVVIEDGVTSIGDYAFYCCHSLSSVTIPDSVTSIGNSAFSGCDSLTSVTIPDGVTSIGYSAFEDCSSLTSVAIPDSVTSIGDQAFYYCSRLTSVTIPDSVTSIGRYAFEYCSSLTSVTIPDSVTSIGDQAFLSCSSLTSVTIPDSVTTIGVRAFCDCDSLTSVTIPDSVTSIGGDAFYGCVSLSSINVDSGNSVYSSMEGVLLNKDGTTLIQCPGGKSGAYSIPNCVTTIGDYAFYYCTSLTSITIPDSVTSIGEYAFYDCTSLASVTIPDSVTSIGGRAFYDCDSLTSITIPGSVTSIGDRAFYDCDSLTSITIPDSVTSIGAEAFLSCDSLTSVTIPDSVTSIGVDAFYGCVSLSSINVNSGNSVYSSMEGVLLNKDGTTLIQCPEGKSGAYSIPDSVTSIGYRAFCECTSLTSVTIPDSVTSIGAETFGYCTSLTSVTIPDSVTSIEDYAFYECTSLTSVTIPDSVTSIGSYAFENCTSLTSIIMLSSSCDISEQFGTMGPQETTVLHSLMDSSAYYYADRNGYAFTSHEFENGECTFCGMNSVQSGISDETIEWSLNVETGELHIFGSGDVESMPWDSYNGIIKHIEIGDEITSIPSAAFFYYENLISVQFGSGISEVPSSCFFGCEKLESIYLPDTLEYLNSNAFHDCTSLSEIRIPANLEGIYSGAFSRCTGLTDIYFGTGTAPYISDDAFEDATATIHYPEGNVSWMNKTENNYGGSITWEAYEIGTIGGACGNNLTWTIEDGMLIIAGTGSMEDFSYVDSNDSDANIAPWYEYCDYITGILVSESITNIGDYAFQGCHYATSASISKNTTTIGDYAFNGCGIAEIDLPNTVISIGKYAFASTNITQMVLPEGLTEIQEYAFTNCNSLEDIHFPSTLKTVGEGAFEWTSVEEVYVPDMETWCNIKFDEFFSTPFAEYGGTKLYIGGVEATDIVIPEGVTTIGTAQFQAYQNIGSITIPNTVTRVEDSAFDMLPQGAGTDSKLTSITFPASVTYIGKDALRFQENLEAIYILNPDCEISSEMFFSYFSAGPVVYGYADSTAQTYAETSGFEFVAITEPKPTEPTPTEPAVNFTDVTKDKWFYDTVQWAVDNGITNGTTATTFAPDDTCTRNQVVTFLWRAEGEPEPASANNPFVDVKESDYFYKAVLWAVENGITNGMDATHFDPNGKCTRGQVVTFLHRAAGKPAPKSTDNPFTDVGQDYYTDAVLWAVGEGITDGMTPTTFEPNTTCTRAQIVTFLNRAYT